MATAEGHLLALLLGFLNPSVKRFEEVDRDRGIFFLGVVIANLHFGTSRFPKEAFPRAALAIEHQDLLDPQAAQDA